MSQKPNVLVFGGCNGLGPLLARYLVPLQGEPLVSHLRLVDKFSIFPPTTYVGKDLPMLLQDRKDIIEYRQANLTNPATVAKCFNDPAPNGNPYTYVLDMSGEREFDRPAEVQIAQTFNVALGIAREAAKQGNVKAYVRTLHAFYDHATEKKNYKEEDAEGWKPLGTRGVWWHEMVRAVASVPNLPLVVLRKAYGYGPGLAHGEVAQHLALSLVYRSLGEEMKFLWSPQLKKNTIHTSDVVGIMWAAAEWAAGLDRQKMEALAGVRLPPTGNDGVKNVPNAIQKEQGGVIVPVFNLVDESDTNQDSMTQVLAEVFGIKVGYQGSISSQLARLRIETVVEEVNEMHMAEWTNIIGSIAEPPVPSTPLSPYVHSYQLEKRGCALNGEKVKKVLGYRLTHPHFDATSVREVVESYRSDGIWPETSRYPPS